MSIILSVIILIVFVSLYDYFSSKNWQQVTSSTRNDIVFQERNKEYGAYKIRQDYDKRVILIILSLCLLIGASYGTYKFIKSLPVPTVEEVEPDLTQFELPPAVEEEVLPPPAEEPPPPMEETIAFPEPVVEDDVVENEIAIVEDLKDTKADLTTQDGNTEFAGDIVEDKGPAIVEVVKDEIIEDLDEVAQYPGGTAAFRAFLESNLQYPQIAIEENLEGKCFVGFVVDKNGNMSDITILKKVPGCPECDAEAVRVVKRMPRWVPGKKNGAPVKSRWQVPITFVLQ